MLNNEGMAASQSSRVRPPEEGLRVRCETGSHCSACLSVIKTKGTLTSARTSQKSGSVARARRVFFF